ncbi:beta-ketoacyl synthase chain length factor [Empedobacter sedimenti]|uniref:beta-ketoacyl synthase chain length factor n=1 Tax=Empedobacter sedimenti TaxID=3042610 RepID=UPI0024A6AB89|nr:beta-ketoacyl synthase chain length factor [Empedobacter sedimenti]
MKEVFVNGLGFVNAQFIDKITNDFLPLETSITKAKSPILKDIISPAMSRRMASGVKMGIYSSLNALIEAGIQQPEAIITGTAMGCMVDSEKFLTSIIENKEEFLTPTAFIQSTHNTVGSQIALHLGCNAYNFTYSNGSNSFENALLDGFLQVENQEVNNALIGGIDEIGERFYYLKQLIGEIELENNKGIKYSEGAHFGVLSNEKRENSFARILDVSIQNVYEDLYSEILKFIQLNHINLTYVDAIISGVKYLNNNELTQIELYEYKDFIGEFGTSSAFGFVLGCELLKKQTLPNQFKMNDVSTKSYKNVLLVNGYKGKDLSLVLLQST